MIKKPIILRTLLPLGLSLIVYFVFGQNTPDTGSVTEEQNTSKTSQKPNTTTSKSADTLIVEFDKYGKLISSLPPTLDKDVKFLKIRIEKDTTELSKTKAFISQQAEKAKTVIATSDFESSDYLYFLASTNLRKELGSGVENLKDTKQIEIHLKDTLYRYITNSQYALTSSLSNNAIPFDINFFNGKIKKWVHTQLKDTEEYYEATVSLKERVITDNLNIQITHKDVLKEAIIRYYNVMADSLIDNIKLLMKQNATIIKNANQLLNPYRSLMDSLIQYYSIYDSKCADNLDLTGCPQIQPSKRIGELYCILNLILCKIHPHTDAEVIWLRYFLLLNGGKIQFDPFTFSDDEDMILQTLADSATLQQNRALRSSFTTISKVENSIIMNLEKGKEQETRNYYYGSLPFTNSKQYKKSYPDDYQITHIVHNVPDSLKIKIHITETSFKEESFFAANIKIIDSLTSLLGLLNNQNAVVKIASSLIMGKVLERFDSSNMVNLVPDIVRETSINAIHFKEDSLLYTGKIPPSHLDVQNDKTAAYSSRVLDIVPNDPPEVLNYSFYSVNPKGNTDTIYNSSYKVGKRMRIQVAAGIAYTFNHVWETTASTSVTGDTLKIQNDEDRLRLVIGLKFYPIKGLYLSDSRFLGSTYGTALQRLSIFTGFSLPSPLKNIYLGLGWDLLPGLNLNGGVHFYQNRIYKISNNSIDRESLDYKIAAPYAAVTIDPQVLISVFKFIGQSF